MSSHESLLTELELELGAKEPLPVTSLSTVEVTAFTEAVRESRALHAAELRQAISNALEQVPWVLRGALRKVLF